MYGVRVYEGAWSTCVSLVSNNHFTVCGRDEEERKGEEGERERRVKRRREGEGCWGGKGEGGGR